MEAVTLAVAGCFSWVAHATSCPLTNNVVAQAHSDARVLLELLQCAVEARLVGGLQHKVGDKVVHKEAKHLCSEQQQQTGQQVKGC